MELGMWAPGKKKKRSKRIFADCQSAFYMWFHSKEEGKQTDLKIRGQESEENRTGVIGYIRKTRELWNLWILPKTRKG